ncbi:MAG: Gldg family protein, partial [Lentisphaeraceae bacterium]|nr:Gldg family protein [Lentisphaeraceae bacterium]
QKGVLDIRDLIYFISFISFGLMCSTVFLRYRKAAHKFNSLFSTCGTIALVVILLLVNYLSRGLDKRIDLSADKLYTLTASTHAVMRKLDAPVSVRFYYSKSDNTQSIAHKAYALRIEDLLKEYTAASNKLLSYEIIDPKPGSSAERRAELDGIKAILHGSGAKTYFGISLSYKNNILSIPKLSKDAESSLEFSLTNLFRSISVTSLPRVGLITNLPITEQKATPGSGNYQNRPAWRIVNELKKDYTLSLIDDRKYWGLDASGDNVFSLIIVMYFGQLPDNTLYALNQHILRGGKVLLFDDAVPLLAKAVDKDFSMSSSLPYYGSGFSLTRPWGIHLNINKMATDTTSSMVYRNESDAGWLKLTDESSFNRAFLPLHKINSVSMRYSGSYEYVKREGISVTPIIKTTEKGSSLPVKQWYTVRRADAKFEKTESRNLTIQVKGKLPSVIPVAEIESKHLSRPVAAAEVILFGDMDMLEDYHSTMSEKSLTGENKTIKVSDNIELFVNTVDYLINGGDMIYVRMRREKKRELEYLKNLRSQQEKQFFQERVELKKEQQKHDRVVYSMNRKRNNQVRLNEDELLQFANAEAELARIKERSHEMSRLLQEEEESAQRSIVLLNAFSVPILILLFGVFVTMYRKIRLARS